MKGLRNLKSIPVMLLGMLTKLAFTLIKGMPN